MKLHEAVTAALFLASAPILEAMTMGGGMITEPTSSKVASSYVVPGPPPPGPESLDDRRPEDREGDVIPDPMMSGISAEIAANAAYEDLYEREMINDEINLIDTYEEAEVFMTPNREEQVMAELLPPGMLLDDMRNPELGGGFGGGGVPSPPVDDLAEGSRRSLVQTGSIGTFGTLQCNMDAGGFAEDGSDCTNLVSSLTVPESPLPLTIPCGVCYTFDAGADVTYPGGLDIQGKLLFPPGYETKISTPFVIVQGELEITSTAPVAPENESVKFELTGTGQHTFNSNVCPNNQCDIGKKAFVVPGGKLNIRGLPEMCPTWTKLKGMAKGGMNELLPEDRLKTYAPPPPSCSPTIMSFQFDQGSKDGWTGNRGALSTLQSESLVVTNRKATWQGPTYDFSYDTSCLRAGQDYLVTFWIRLDKADGSDEGQETTCQRDGQNCLALYSKILKTDGHEINHWKAGQRKGQAGRYGELVPVTGHFQFDEDELNPSNIYWVFQMSNPEVGVDITLERFEITLPEEQSYQSAAEPCSELAPGGDAESNGYNPYPMYTNHDKSWLRVEIEKDANNNDNHFYRLSNRIDHWASMALSVNPSCFSNGLVYRTSQRVRIHSDVAASYYVEFVGIRANGSWFGRRLADCAAQSNTEGWVTCNADFIADDELRTSQWLRWQLIVNNHQAGSLADVDYDDVSISFQSGPVQGLLVDSSVVGCWGVGAQVHVTSSTFSNRDGQDSSIETLEDRGDGTAVLKLADALNSVISEEDSPDFGVEVALLSRNIKITGAEEEERQGGYLQVLHTPGVPQMIDGVEFKNMGQQAVKNRYPIQFLYSGNVTGTVVSRNAIRESHQRCIVIEGTSETWILSNVAHNTAGHCFMVGFESENNSFERNLGSRTNNNIPWNNKVAGDEDHRMATFFSYYPPNNFEGNVAAGSDGHGFFFHNWWWNRGEDGQNNGLPRPRQMKMGRFSFNEAHSNSWAGFAGYDFEQDLNGHGPPVIESFLSYRNQGQGLYMQASQGTQILHSLVADNRVGIEIPWTDEALISGTDVRGLSDLTKEATKAAGIWKLCPHNSDPVVGIKTPTSLFRKTATRHGTTLQNVTFSFFDNSDDCPGSAQTSFVNWNTRDKHWNYHTSLAGVTVSDSRGLFLDLCSAESMAVDDVVLEDFDGGCDPTDSAMGHSTIVSNQEHMTAFATCAAHPEHKCLSYCPDTCMRTVTFFTEYDGTEQYKLNVKDETGDKEILVSGKAEVNTPEDHFLNKWDSRFRSFSATLPGGGSYTVTFLDSDGNSVRPIWVQEMWERPPDCEGYPTAADITMVGAAADPATCGGSIVTNGDMEAGHKHWRHNIWNGNIDVLEGFGMNASRAISTANHHSPWHFLGQHLDTSCLHANEGKFYEIKAYLHLKDKDGVALSCDPNRNPWSGGCPKATFKYTKYHDAGTKESVSTHWQGDRAHATIPYNKDGFNLIHGIFKVARDLPLAQSLFLYFEYAPARYDIVLDDVSVTPFDPGCDEFIMNGDFSTGSTAFWHRHGSPYMEMVEGAGGLNDYAVKSSERGWLNNGPRQELNLDCLSVGDRIVVTGRHKVEKNGETYHCDPNTWDGNTRCSDIYMHSSKTGYNNEYRRVADVAFTASAEVDGWNAMAGVHTISAGHQNADYLIIYFDGVHKDSDLIVDDVSVKHLPQSCDSLVLNPSFEDGTTSFWLSDDRWWSKVGLHSPGADGSDFALRSYGRNYRWRGVWQPLDTRCFVEGQEFEITAKFRLLNSTGGGVMCNKDVQWVGDENCPPVHLQAYNCHESRPDFWLRFWNEIPFFQWNPDGYNDFRASFTVDSDLASCQNIRVHIREINSAWDVIADDFQITGPREPTQHPTSSPVEVAPPDEEASPSAAPVVVTPIPTALSTSCPNIDDVPEQIDAGSTFLTRSDSLCMLTKTIAVGNDTSVVPIARSYSGNNWETSAGDATMLLLGQSWLCYPQGCQIELPPLNDGETYSLTSYGSNTARRQLSSEHRTKRDLVARLLESTTFGPTTAELDGWDYAVEDMNVAMADYVADQMNATSVGLTSHREFFRRRANPRFTGPMHVAKADHPCNKNARWRAFAFTRKDNVWWKGNVLRITGLGADGTAPYSITLNGHVRTIVQDIQFMNENYAVNQTFDYIMCWSPEARLGGVFHVVTEDETCQALANPAIDFTGYESLAGQVLNLGLPDLIAEIDQDRTNGEEFILLKDITEPVCETLPDVVEEDDPPIFGKLPNGMWLQYDPRLELYENTPSNPIEDAGGSIQLVTGGATLCSNAARTFLNEDQCILSSESSACGVVPAPEVEIDLNEENIIQLHSLTQKYVYVMLGLTVVDAFNNKISHPCVYGHKSRWSLKQISECNPTSLDAETNNTLFTLLMNKENSNPHVIDITVPNGDTEGIVCKNYTDPRVEIIVGGTCYEHVHPDHMSVYDLSVWTKNDTHPGNMMALMEGEYNPIKKWLDQNSSAFIIFPSHHPEGEGFDHPITRWENNKKGFPYIGRYGDSVQFRDLPNELRLDNVAEHYGATGGVTGSGIMVCGSPGEVPNDPSLGNAFDISTGRDTTWGLEQQNEQVWTMIALSAPDQLRQRVAWALAQLLVVVKVAVQSRGGNTEFFLNYYDIFTRHAFGNYRDILREVSYNALMAENLSYLQSRSAAYMWENQNGKISFADENYAREIMQLFSIGLVELNLDGTPKLDESGRTIPTYTNEDIMSFARVWTGFDLRQKRGNTEDSNWSGNRLDPMRIDANWRDRFPKSDLSGGYIGDRYPLCVDLPTQMFLKKGAHYRLLGSSSLPELMEDPSQFATDPTIRRFVLDENSHLRNLLCNEDINGNCQFVNSLTLESNMDCTTIECNVDTVRIVQVTSNIFYEYVRPACVEQSFFSGAMKLSQRYKSWGRNTCGNPLLPVAGEACCETGSQNAIKNPVYDGERVTHQTAMQRCADMGRMVCDYNEVRLIDNDAWHKTGHQWAKDQCLIRAKINPSGAVAIVYEPEKYIDKVPHIDERVSLNFFKVYWDGDHPTLENECAGNACKLQEDNTCLCDTSVAEVRVFSSMPASAADLMSKLYIGAFDPAAYGTYTVEVDAATGITAFTIDGNYDTNTIFEVTSDTTGETFFLKNAHETVNILSSGMKFRNAPHFMSLIHPETTIRDAQYETEAALDHYFYHDNTAPFIAIRLIQRLVSSNPTPRYIEQVARAFRVGSYQSGGQTFGTGEYGDLKAAIAAVLLDREARDVILDDDPSSGLLREPLLKVISLMRSMEYVSEANQPTIWLPEIQTKIGQMAHEFPSVFSFFLPENVPVGRLGDAHLVCPECMLLDMPKTVGALNGMFSLIKYGLASCNYGFGHHSGSGGCNDGQYNKANGILHFVPSPANVTDSSAIVDELATLLTAGRLSGSSRQIVQNAYDAAADSQAGLRIAQQLIVTSPEFHSTNAVKKAEGKTRPPPTMPQPSDQPYKAVVYLMFAGGCDSFNMLVPYGNCTGKDLFAEYTTVREQVALSQVQLQDTVISADNQVCEKFALHQNLPFLKEMYDDGDLLFMANTGVMTRPVNKENYWQLTETALFAHNHMQREAMRIDPLEEATNTGVLGRMSDTLTKQGMSVGSFSLDRFSISLSGIPGDSPSAFIISQNGVNEFNSDPSKSNMMEDITSLNEATKADSGFFAETWSDSLLRSLSHNHLLRTTLENMETMTEFPNTSLGRKLQTVARMIATRAERAVERDFYFVDMGGYDTHADVADHLVNRFTEVNDAISSFAAELKAKDIWKAVTTIQTSDFARTLVPNSGDGTDHAWGGNYFMFGGDVAGGQIVGAYPGDLTDDGPLGLGRGRLVPTTPWDAPFQAIAQWTGVDAAADLDTVCPNRENFPESWLFTENQLFKASVSARRARKNYLRK